MSPERPPEPDTCTLEKKMSSTDANRLEDRIAVLEAQIRELRTDLESLGEVLKGEEKKYWLCQKNCEKLTLQNRALNAEIERLKRQMPDPGFDPQGV